MPLLGEKQRQLVATCWTLSYQSPHSVPKPAPQLTRQVAGSTPAPSVPSLLHTLRPLSLRLIASFPTAARICTLCRECRQRHTKEKDEEEPAEQSVIDPCASGAAQHSRRYRAARGSAARQAA